METSKSHPEADFAVMDDRSFLNFLVGKGVKLHANEGQLRVTAAPGVLSDDLRAELKRRKPSLILLTQAAQTDDLRKTDLGVRARRISPAGQWTPHLQYWKTQLEGAPGITELPFMKRVQSPASLKTATVPFQIPHNTLLALKNLGAEESTSVETVLLAGFSLLIHRYTGKSDFCLGLPKMRRQRRRDAIMEEMVENTLCLRCKTSPGMTFRSLLGAINQTAQEAYMHSSVPLARLLSVLPVETGLGMHPLFQILFGVDISGAADPTLIDNGDSVDFAYHLAIYPNGANGQGHFRFREDLYSAESMSLFAECYMALLDEIAATPDCSIAKLSMLSPARREQVLVKWNQTDIGFPKSSGIHALFERAAEHFADSTAVIAGDRTATYSELNERANRLAHFLLAKNLSRDAIVGICMRRSIDMVASMLAVLKAGYAYLPLDPVYPAQRLEAMLADSGAELVLADTKVREPLAINERKIARIDMDAQEIQRMPASNPQVPVSPNDAAYVIYTSGSTGHPKGVTIEHHSTVSFLTWGASVFTKEELACVFAATSICFDLSVFEIFLPLGLGGAVALGGDFLELSRVPSSVQPTLLNTVPSAMSSYLASQTIPSSVRCINLAGEFLSEALVDLIRRQAPTARIFDLYGPTETTTYSTFTAREQGMSATIGRPLANTKIFILDSSLQPVPPGVPGQIFIGGEGVARGYLHRPELTAERFITVDSLPYTGRLYSTGDLGRFRSNGEIEYLGRMDNQVKIRGFRVEPGEIENTLQQHPRIREAAVVVDVDDALGISLAAFVTISSGPVYRQELITFQKKFLPAHMVVNQIVIMDSLPTTLNGKIDRKALKALPVSEMTVPSEQSSSTVSTLQHQIQSIWEKNFKRKPIGIDDDFFALGGHSLLAFQIFNDIEKSLKVAMVLSVLFKAPTIRLLAQEIEQKEHMERQYALH